MQKTNKPIASKDIAVPTTQLWTSYLNPTDIVKSVESEPIQIGMECENTEPQIKHGEFVNEKESN